MPDRLGKDGRRAPAAFEDTSLGRPKSRAQDQLADAGQPRVRHAGFYQGAYVNKSRLSCFLFVPLTLEGRDINYGIPFATGPEEFVT